MTTEEAKHVENIVQAIAALNNDATDPNCTVAGYATQAFTRLNEEIRPALVALGFEVQELEPVPNA